MALCMGKLLTEEPSEPQGHVDVASFDSDSHSRWAGITRLGTCAGGKGRSNWASSLLLRCTGSCRIYPAMTACMQTSGQAGCEGNEQIQCDNTVS